MQLTLNNFKQVMIAKARRRGLYENFGEKEIRKLKDKYGYDPYSINPEVKAIVEKIDRLNQWRMNFEFSNDGCFKRNV